MSPREIKSNHCPKRGLRLIEEFERIFPEMSRTSRAAEIATTEGSIRNWEAGGNIDNRALGEIAKAGGDIFYILTGERLNTFPAGPLSKIQRLAVMHLREAMEDILDQMVKASRDEDFAAMLVGRIQEEYSGLPAAVRREEPESSSADRPERERSHRPERPKIP